MEAIETACLTSVLDGISCGGYSKPQILGNLQHDTELVVFIYQ